MTVLDDIDFDALPEDEAPGPASDSGKLVCPDCGQECKNARGLSMHRKRSHGVESEKDDTKPASLRKGNLEKELTEFLLMISMMVTFVNATDGNIIRQQAPALAHAYANLARQNKAFRKFLEGMMKTGAMGEVFTVTLFTALPILANHGKLPPEIMAFFGGTPPMEQG